VPTQKPLCQQVVKQPRAVFYGDDDEAAVVITTVSDKNKSEINCRTETIDHGLEI
jgi:hypothetical protein